MVMRDLDGRATLARVVMAMRALVATVIAALGAMVTLDHVVTATLVRGAMVTPVLVATVIAVLGAMVTPARAGMVTGEGVERATGAASTLRVRGRGEHPIARRAGSARAAPTARICRGTTIRASLTM